MCYAYGSTDHATGVCPMCKVFKPSARSLYPSRPHTTGAHPLRCRCPHIKEVCHNRANHPRHDVVYLKNAEVQTFTGCGFCKWAATNPPPKFSGYQNPGWPGCCRPPSANDQKFIGAADWPAVSHVHHVPIPLEIKAILDNITAASKNISSHASPTGSTKSPSSQSPAPSMVRRASSNMVGSPRTDTTPARTPPMTIPIKGRSGGSPTQLAISLNNTSRNSNGDGTASSLPNKPSIDQFQPQRRTTVEIQTDKRSESSQHSPGRKQAELGGTVARRSTERGPPISAALPSMSLSKVTVDIQPARRRAATTTTNPPPMSSRTAERPNQNLAPPSLSRRTSAVGEALATMSISGSSSSSGSNSETTVISDGGFTDYLSDESEAELQRQAEVKAAQLAQNHMEEQEFKAARQQLASVDLRPPKSWTGNVNSTPRSQTSTAPATGYPQASPYSNATYVSGHASVASSTPSRG
ncbi:hypothetical protein B0H21DRAFT_577554 [Amylocystis lapponica]|nr:hypothetical protein B0H21DRAFT_577554 [Amylocystis lapponica]